MYAACYPATRPIRVTEPTFEQEPLGFLAARRQVGLGESVDYHDQDLKDLIVAAREQVEHDTGIICYTGSFTWKLSEFPVGDTIPIYGVRPVTAVTPITYVATDGTVTTWGTVNTEYSLKSGGLVPCIALGYGYTWPSVRGDQEGITITLTAGFASVQAIPAKVRQAVKLKLHELWLLKNEMDTDNTVAGYERMVELIRRDDYA